MVESEDACLQVLCKACKSKANSSPRCVICGASYHPSCARPLKKMKFIKDSDKLL